MGFLRWLGGIIVLFWVLGLIFKIGGGMIHLLLVIAAVVFIVDMISGRKKV
ncbi:lmo0937 family membrane protein [Clostridium estertheticum]|uniref:lmo0937 family membrane protein n=1 Tax=Clostridium estertheticum TaxID=238834 RepID=UPI001C7D4AB8|nr:lmo0937 family membrane protein [Clostridium estertheticum]MBX4266247.1 lmo0937 family membrane protein [Clostridium estertheticum]WLC89947.1 lmo0937 family membrane protein [Clostridium estertheticum]